MRYTHGHSYIGQLYMQYTHGHSYIGQLYMQYTHGHSYIGQLYTTIRGNTYNIVCNLIGLKLPLKRQIGQKSI